MPNIGKFNAYLFNSGARGMKSWGITDQVIFNWFWLQNEFFVTTKVNVWNMPGINLLTYENPKSDWGGLLDRFYKQRTITIAWHIHTETSKELNNRIDALKKALSIKQGYLDMRFWGEYRRILCTLTNSDIINREHYDITHANFTLTFRAEKPFWSERTRESILFEAVDTEINEDIYNTGSEYSLPIINILVQSETNLSSITVWIGDDALTVTTSFEANDILKIDTDNKTVTLNDNSVDFTWKFPRLESWVNNLNVVWEGTYSLDISLLYPKNYL